MFKDATKEEIESAAGRSWEAFKQYRKTSLRERASLLRSIAEELKKDEESLLELAMGETSLDRSRLSGELVRTIFQLTSYATACEQGIGQELRIDTADPARTPPKPDLRKMLVPLGPVAVFGASNFPFAYSTAGGDTACALAAGCTVLLKAHPAHAATSEAVAKAVTRALQQSGLPGDVFIHIHGGSFDVGKTLVQHPMIKAVGFTGSFTGGKALFDFANDRAEPIPVFAEMGSVNPVFLLPQKLKKEAKEVAAMYAASITLSAGQFCTNPGILVGIEGEELDEFKTLLGRAIEHVSPQKMLHEGIATNFHKNRASVLKEEGVQLLAESGKEGTVLQSLPTVAETTATAFLSNPFLQHEVFGPFSLLVKCRDGAEMKAVAEKLYGQLTVSILATGEELSTEGELLQLLMDKAGRVVFNGVPTGVEVALSMHHGGPFPATTDSRFTSVGADGIRRFGRPLCWQNAPETMLPDELKNNNPLNLWRIVNNSNTKDVIS